MPTAKQLIKKQLLLKMKKRMVKLRLLVESFRSLNELGNVKLPATISFKLGVVLKDVNEQVKIFEKVRVEKLKELGEEIMDYPKDKDGKPDKKKEKKATGNYDLGENKEKFTEEIDKLLDEDVEVKVPEVKIDQLKDVEGKELEISPSVFSTLDWLIKL